MTTAQTAERRTIYKKIRSLSDENAALVMGYIQSLETISEPELNEDETAGLSAANSELARGEGRPFRDALKDLW